MSGAHSRKLSRHQTAERELESSRQEYAVSAKVTGLSARRSARMRDARVAIPSGAKSPLDEPSDENQEEARQRAMNEANANARADAAAQGVFRLSPDAAPSHLAGGENSELRVIRGGKGRGRADLKYQSNMSLRSGVAPLEGTERGDVLDKYSNTSSFALSGKYNSHLGISVDPSGSRSKARASAGGGHGTGRHTHDQLGSGDGTFLTGVDIEDEEQDEIPTDPALHADLSSIVDAMRLVPATITTDTPALPAKVHVFSVMQEASQRIPFEHPRQQAVWAHYFDTHASRAVIHDSFWWVMVHFLEKSKRRQAKLYRRDNKSGKLGNSRVNTAATSASQPVALRRQSSIGTEVAEDTALDEFVSTDEEGDDIFSIEDSDDDDNAKSAKGKDGKGGPGAEEADGREAMGSAQGRRERSDVELSAKVAAKRRKRRGVKLAQELKLDEVQSRMQNKIKTRLSQNFVRLFTGIKSVHKDDFFRFYHDGLSQSIFYAIAQAYPDSRSLIDSDAFKKSLYELVCTWTQGYVPTNNNLHMWKKLEKETKQDTFLQHALNRSTVTPKVTLENKLSVDRRSQRTGQRSRYRRDDSSLGLSPSASMRARSNLGLNSTRRTRGTPSRSYGAHALQLASADGGASETGRSGHSRRNGRLSGTGRMMMTRSRAGTRGRRQKQSGMPWLEKFKPTNDTSMIPLKVVRKRRILHHSDLVQHFLNSIDAGNASNHALTMPITVAPDDVDSSVSDFLNAMKQANAKRHEQSTQLKEDYETMQHRFAKMARREQKQFAEQRLKLKQDKDRALRERAQFSKTLVSEYQEKKYVELDEPSKSLGLRRLGHYRTYKDEQLAGSVMHEESNNPVLAQTSKRATNSTSALLQNM